MSSENPEETSSDGLIHSEESETSLLSKENQIVQETLEEFLMFEKSHNDFSDFLSKLDKDQVDQVLKAASDSDKRHFDYAMAKLKADQELEKDRISGQQLDKITRRNALMLIIGFIVVTTLVILLFKDTYFDKWLTFVIGLLGGSGMTALFNKNYPASNSDAKAD